MKKKTSIIISSIAAVSILASAFAVNSFAVGNPVDQSPITASNIALAQTVKDSTPSLQTDTSSASNALKATPVSTAKNCPKTQNNTTTNTLNNIKSADITAPQNVVSKSNCKNSTAKNTNLTSIKARLEAFLKENGINSASIPGLNTSAAKTNTASKPTTSKPTTSTPSTTATNGDYSAFQKKVVDLVNAERAKNGLKPLTMNAELSKVATLKSQDMAKLNYFDHNSPTYGSPFDMMKKFGISYRTAGENIAMGQSSPEQVMQGWMNSPGHRANILKSSFTQIGVGVAKNANGQLYWTQQFIG